MPWPWVRPKVQADKFRFACAVKHLHSQEPPIAHRDIKIENVLLHEDGTYKVSHPTANPCLRQPTGRDRAYPPAWQLCDFGSCSTNHRSYSTTDEILAAQKELEANTTPAYRSPEMIDLHSKKLVGIPVDIWALGCLLYKMAFYKDAFNTGNAIHIKSGKYLIPSDSPYNAGLHELIGFLLQG